MTFSILELLKKHDVLIQERSFSCGPVAIRNLQSFLGYEPSSIEELIEMCNAEEGRGTRQEDLVAALNTLDVAVVEEKYDGTITDLEKHLDQRNTLILNVYDPYDEVGHYNVLIEHDDRALYFIDSDAGLLRLKKEDFPKFWHNGANTIQGWFVAVKKEA